jgi:alkaline phosphatase
MFKHLAGSLLSAALLSGFNAGALADVSSPEDSTALLPRHVILIIGDGMDDQQITIARNYLKGAAGRLLLDELPVRSTAQVLSTQDSVNGKPVYVSDSANTATSLATGVVTSRGRISTTPGSDEDIPTIIELAEAAGYRTGLVTTASVTDATPSAFAVHISFRLCENPELMEEVVFKDIFVGECQAALKANGGPGSIAEQLASSSVDVILGGGSKHFAPQVEGRDKSVLEVAIDRGFQHLSSAAELDSASMGPPLLGLFSRSTMPVRLRGENGRAAEEVETSLLHMLHDYLGEATLPVPMHCEPNPESASVPSLKQMTDAALAHLSHNNVTGFFLMIESASIDKQSHERKPCGSIGELEQLEEALQSALAFAENNPDTLILVTADHGQAAQIIPYESLFSRYPIPIYPPGSIARIITPEGSHMTVNYGTSNFIMEEHTGANVPLFSNAAGLGIVPAFVQQPDLFTISKEYLGL